MTYKELYDKAVWDLEHDKITLGEFEKMIEPLNKEIPKEEQTDGVITELEKITERINEIKGDNKYVVSDYMYGRYQAFDIVADIIADRIAELKGEPE